MALLNDINDFLQFYNVGKCIDFEVLAKGATNSNFLIRTYYKHYVLTLFEEVKDVDFLLQVHESLKDQFPCAQVIKASKDNQTLKQKPALLFSFVNGSSVINPSSNHCQLIGQYLAKLHQIDFNFLQNRSKIKGLLWSIEEANHLMSCNISDEDVDIIEHELHYFRQHSRLILPMGLIHTNCFRDNVLFIEENGLLKLTAVIDFEYATRGAYMFDLAIVINDWCSQDDGRLDRLKMRDIIAAYNQVRPLELLENQSIPLMLRAAAFHFWVSRLMDKKKNADKFKRILLNRRLNLSGMQNH